MYSKHFVRLSLLVFGASATWGIQAWSAPMPPCGSATVIAGTDSCETLAVKFDLSACEDTIPEGERPKLTCMQDKGYAEVKTAKAKYRVEVKPTTDSFGKSSWGASGAVLRATLDDAKPAPVAKPVAKAPPAPKKPTPPPPAPAAPVAAAAPAAPAAAAAVVGTPASAPAAASAAAPAAAAKPAAAPAAPAAAPAPTPFKIGGHFRTRYESNDSTDYASRRSGIVTRIRPNFTLTPAPEVTLNFEPQFAKAFGERSILLQNNLATGGTATTTSNNATVPNPAAVDSSGTTHDTNLFVHQAYADWHPNDWMNLYVGRQVLSYGNELVIGGLDWHNVARSFDAIRGRFKHGIGWTDVFWSKLVELNPQAPSSFLFAGAATDAPGDRDLLGLYTSMNLAAWLKALDFYYLYRRDATPIAASTSGVGPRLNVLGVRAQSNVADFDYRWETTFETGAGGDISPNLVPNTTTAFQTDLEVGYTFEPTLKPRFAFEFFTASKAYDQLYPTVHKWLGYADVLGRRNVTGFAIHTSIKPTADLSVELDFHNFSRTSTDQSAFKLFASDVAGTRLGSAASASSKGIGNELDLTLSYNASKAVNFAGGYSLFMPGAYLKEQFLGRTAKFAFVHMMVKF